MSKDEIQRMIDSMDPLEAAALLAGAAKKLFPVLDDELRRGFLLDLVEVADRNNEAGLVHF